MQPAIESAGDRFELTPATESDGTRRWSKWMMGLLFAAIALAALSIAAMRIQSVKPPAQSRP